jgi:hypothetical protein
MKAGCLLEQRIQFGDCFKDGFEGTGCQKFCVHVSLFCFQSQTETPKDEDNNDNVDDDDDPSSSMVQFECRQAKSGVCQLVGDHQQGELLSGNVLSHPWNEPLGWDG